MLWKWWIHETLYFVSTPRTDHRELSIIDFSEHKCAKNETELSGKLSPRKRFKIPLLVMMNGPMGVFNSKDRKMQALVRTGSHVERTEREKENLLQAIYLSIHLTQHRN